MVGTTGYHRPCCSVHCLFVSTGATHGCCVLKLEVRKKVAMLQHLSACLHSNLPILHVASHSVTTNYWLKKGYLPTCRFKRDQHTLAMNLAEHKQN